MENLTELEKLAQKFSEEVGREYEQSIEFWIIAEKVDEQERKKIEEKIEAETLIIKENAYKTILEWMNNPKEIRKNRLKKGIFRKRKIIVIDYKTEFFDNLLPGKQIKYIFSAYYIDVERLFFEKVEHR